MHDDKVGFFMGLLVVGLVIGIIALLIIGEQQKRETLSKFDYEKVTSIGKDFEFTICEKINPCGRCRTRDFLSMNLQRIKKIETSFDSATKTTKTDVRRYTLYIIYCGQCGIKTVTENRNLADALYAWEKL